MSIINVEISGISPLLMNRFTEEAEESVSSGRRKVARGAKKTPREQAEAKAYKLEDGSLYLPANNIFTAIIQAGTFIKDGKSKLTTQKSSIVPAGIIMESVVCPLGTKEFEVDSRRVVIPATGGAIMGHRPRLDQWKTAFTLLVDDTMFDVSLVRELVDIAGSKIGVGDFRPSKRGPFGRFKVVHWEVEKEKKAA